MSRIASIDSCFASPMKPQVLTTMTSADSGAATKLWPASAVWPSMTSVSTRFFGQPSDTKWTFMTRKACGKPGRLPRRRRFASGASSPASREHEHVAVAVLRDQRRDVALDHAAARDHGGDLGRRQDLVGRAQLFRERALHVADRHPVERL